MEITPEDAGAVVWSSSDPAVAKVNANGYVLATGGGECEISATAGGYNYIGIHGWTMNPLVEFFIVDDWYTKPGTNLLGQRKGALPDEVLEVHISEEEYVHFEVIGRASEAEVIRTKSNLKRFGQEIKDVVDEEEDTPEEDPKMAEAREMKAFLETHTQDETAQHFNCSRQTVVNRMKLLVERNEG